MADVYSLAKYTGRDTVALVEGLLATAYAEGGSVLLTYRSPKGEERMAFSGVYSRDSTQALKAVLEMSIYLTHLDEKIRGKP